MVNRLYISSLLNIKKTKRHIAFLIVLLLTTVYIYSQESPTSLPDTLRVSNIAQQHGLSQLNVLAFDFDENGYLWAGTEDGLNRFNGYNMKVFSQSPGEENRLTDDHIRGLLYSRDTLWLGTNTHSIQAYLPAKDQFLSFKENEKIAANPSLGYTHKIFELNARYLLASMLEYCILIDRKSHEVFPIPLPTPSKNDYVLSITKRSENEFWLGSYFNGILQLDLKNKEITDVLDFNFFQDSPVYALQKTGPNGILIGCEKGLFHIDDSSGTIKKIFETSEKNAFRCFYDWNKDYFLVGYYNGLMFLNKSTHETHPVVISEYNNHGLSPVEVIQIKEDAGNGVWMATQGKGLLYYHPSRQKFRPQRIQLPKEPEKDFISIFNFLRDGQTLWMATYIGYVKHRLGTQSYKLYRTNRLGYTLAKDFENNIWGGGFNQGLEKYNVQKDVFEDVTLETGIPDRDIAEITPLSEEKIWVSTWSSGIFSVNPKNYETYPVKIEGKNLHRSRASFVSDDGSVWLGADDGLYRIRDGETVIYRNEGGKDSSLSNNRVFSISEDENGHIWIGTAKGLNKLDLSSGKITQYLEQPGLPNDFIYGVLSDDNNDIWVSTNHGVSRLDVKSENFTNYTEQDGLQNNEFNGKAAYKDSLGYLYFGGMNGFNIFHPDSIPVNKYVGKTIIEDVELFGAPIGENIIYTDTISLDYDENVITFNYSSLNFLLPEKNRYQFKMLGFDKDWRPMTKERSTTYTNLNPGTYTFMVKGSNNDLLWGDPDTLTLMIKAPWYATPFFRISIILAVLLIIILTFYYRYSQKKAENLRLQEMVEVRTRELSQSNKELYLAMNTAREQKENISFLMQELNHRVKNNLQLIASLLDIQKDGINDELTRSSLQSAQNRLFTIATVHDLLSTTKPEEKFRLDAFIVNLANELIRFMELDVDTEFDLVPLEINKKYVTPLGIIINELITNTAKHAFTSTTKNKKIQISLTEDGAEAILKYHDNGKGIPEKQLREGSLGINLIQNLAFQLKGQMELLKRKGTTLVIRFKY